MDNPPQSSSHHPHDTQSDSAPILPKISSPIDVIVRMAYYVGVYESDVYFLGRW